MWRLIKVMIILTLLCETSKKSFDIDRCNSKINREPIYTLFIFFFQFSGLKYNYSAAHPGSPRGTPVAEHCSTRNSKTNQSLYLTHYSTNRTQRSLKYLGVRIWNSIPQNIKQHSTYRNFKNSYKYYLISNYE